MTSDEEMLAELRLTNAILKLAFGSQIAAAIQQLLSRNSFRVVMSLLVDGEVASGALVEAAAKQSVARATVFDVVATLDRAGVIIRPKRGTIALTPLAVPYVEAAKPATRRGGGTDSDAGESAPKADPGTSN